MLRNQKNNSEVKKLFKNKESRRVSFKRKSVVIRKKAFQYKMKSEIYEKTRRYREKRELRERKMIKKILKPKEIRQWKKKINFTKIHPRVKLNVINNTYDVLIQTQIRGLKWIMYKVHKEYIYVLKSRINSKFFKKLKKTKNSFYKSTKEEKKLNYYKFQKMKSRLQWKRNSKLKKMSIMKQRIYPRLSRVYYLLCRHSAYKILKKRLKYYMKNFFNRISKISLGIFNFNSQSSAFIAAALAKRRFELKFSGKEVSRMLYHVIKKYASGFYVILAGRFTKNIRATKKETLFGK